MTSKSCHLTTVSKLSRLLCTCSQVEAMKEVSVGFNGLVQELSRLRECTVQGLKSLQEEHDKLEDEIRQAQQRHQTVNVNQTFSLVSNKAAA